jgi:cytochrome P450
MNLYTSFSAWFDTTDPYPCYAQCRKDAPVQFREIDDSGNFICLVFDYESVATVFKDSRFYHSARPLPGSHPKTPANPIVGKMLPSRPDDDRRRVEKVIHEHLSQEQTGLEKQMEETARELVREGAQRGEVDLISEYAAPLVSLMTAKVTGIKPSRVDHFARRITLEKVFGGIPCAEIDEFLSESRDRPSKSDSNSTNRFGALGGAETAANRLLLFLASYRTTIDLIGNSLLALLENPGQLAALRSQPALASQAVEESLRFDPPVQFQYRVPSEDAILNGITIPRGTLVAAIIGSANRDPLHFPEPDAFDISRANKKHLSFGAGRHRCLGASLARTVGKVAIQALADDRIEFHLALERQRLRWNEGLPQHRSLQQLPARFRMKKTGRL